MSLVGQVLPTTSIPPDDQDSENTKYREDRRKIHFAPRPAFDVQGPMFWSYIEVCPRSSTSENEWYGVNTYFIKEINCCWALGARVEWFRDDDGARVDPLNRGANNAVGDYYAVTLGANWRPTTPWTIRPEVRYDWFDGLREPFDPLAGVGTANSLFTAGLDAIYTY